jgi:hypothetical protein
MPTTSRAPLWLWAVLAVFVVAMAAFVAASVTRPVPPGFAPTPLEPRGRPALLAGPDTVTLDAREDDHWVRFDLGTRAVTAAGQPWDVAFKRHRLIVNGGTGFHGTGGVVRLDRPFDSVTQAPPEGYTPSRVSPGGDSVNAVLDDWYRYGYLSHLLTPRPGTFVIRTHDGRYAKLAILDYYCPGAEPGCVTLVYTYQGDGSRALGLHP